MNGRESAGAKPPLLRRQARGIVVSEGRDGDPPQGLRPRISAFVWGDQVRPAPTLPFGRWDAGSI